VGSVAEEGFPRPQLLLQQRHSSQQLPIGDMQLLIGDTQCSHLSPGIIESLLLLGQSSSMGIIESLLLLGQSSSMGRPHVHNILLQPPVGFP
jgi:hypothetical protein